MSQTHFYMWQSFWICAFILLMDRSFDAYIPTCMAHTHAYARTHTMHPHNAHTHTMHTHTYHTHSLTILHAATRQDCL